MNGSIFNAFMRKYAGNPAFVFLEGESMNGLFSTENFMRIAAEGRFDPVVDKNGTVSKLATFSQGHATALRAAAGMSGRKLRPDEIVTAGNVYLAQLKQQGEKEAA